MKETVLLSAFTALESAHFFSAFDPSIFTIETLAITPQARASIRKGEILATAASLVLALVVSKLIKTNLPLVFTLLTDALMVGVYEWALRNAQKGVA